MLRTIYGSNYNDTVAIEHQQYVAKRPHVFVAKLFARKLDQPGPLGPVFVDAVSVNPFLERSEEQRVEPALPPRLITEADFAGVYAAAEFADVFGLPLDTTVTITWGLLGVNTEKAVVVAFSKFEKCLHDWLAQRSLPAAWIYVHECGRHVGLHTHLALHLPGAPCTYRHEFKAWARAWGERRCGRKVPRAIRGSGPTKETPWLHWLNFSYLMKGYDARAIVQSARNASDGEAVRLGDLIAWPWHDPGPVPMKNRVGWSRSLGPVQRDIGYFEGCGPSSGRPAHTLHLMGAPPYRPLQASPFRSKYEDGCRDVRELYSADFCLRVSGINSGSVLSADKLAKMNFEGRSDEELIQHLLTTIQD